MSGAHAGAIQARRRVAGAPGALPAAGVGASAGATLLPLLGVCALAAALRFATLGVQSFDFDESFTVGMVIDGSLGHVLHTIPRTESSPPLYYLLAWLWSRVFGLGPFGIRSLSALLGTALVPVVYFSARRLGSARAALIAALLVALSPFFVWYSQEARTYALLALLSAVSFWSFLRGLDQPRGRRFAAWAIASAAAVLSHYFAAFLIAPEALWLVWATRRRDAVLAAAAVAAVGAALAPLVIRQADNRTQWIEALGLSNRIKEVAKKWLTGEIAPTRNWELAVVAVLAGAPLLYAATRLTDSERRRAALPAAIGAAALVLPLLLDLGGLHYLISKNVMPALPVLVIALALLFAAPRAGAAGVAGAVVACAFSLAVTIDGAIDPALQRPDYRAAVSALGPPARAQVVVTPNLGDAPVALYRPGAAPVAPSGAPVRQIVVVQPLPRADVSSRRAPTPAPPAGFRLAGRRDARTYTLICFSAVAARPMTPASLVSLVGGQSGSDAQLWPRAAEPATGSPCASRGG